jgi:hypothetical protein
MTLSVPVLPAVYYLKKLDHGKWIVYVLLTIVTKDLDHRVLSLLIPILMIGLVVWTSTL